MPIQDILSILACPKCHGDLTLQGSQDQPTGLLCQTCQCSYPIKDGIPVLLLENATPCENHSYEQKA